jgi:hypothetical protein
MKRRFIFIIAFVLVIASLAHAGTCYKYQTQLSEARLRIVASFKTGDHPSLEEAVDDLVFWDSCAQIECSGATLAETPVQWLSSRTKAPLTAHTASFLFWMEDLKRYFDLDISPDALVRERRFEP